MSKIPVLAVARAVAPKAAQNAANTQAVDVVFYTLGDSRDIAEKGSVKIQHTKAWNRRAELLATTTKHVFGVKTVDAAIQAIEGLPANQKIKRIFLLGHGLPGGYFFSGTTVDESGKPLDIDDFRPTDDANVLIEPGPNFTIGAKYVNDLNAEKITEELDAEFRGQVAAELWKRKNAAISVVSKGEVWNVTAIVGSDTDTEVFRVERVGKVLEVYGAERQGDHARATRFIDALMTRMAKAGHVEVNFLSCFTGEPVDDHRIDLQVKKAFEREGVTDFSVGAYIHYYQVHPIAESGKLKDAEFFDFISTPSNGTEHVQNPGADQIPSFERLHGKPSESAPPMPPKPGPIAP